MYKRFKFIDSIVSLNSFRDILESGFQDNLIDKYHPILIPHGTLVSSFKVDEIENMRIPIFGNKWILRWEADRLLKQRLIDESKLISPSHIKSKYDIKELCIVKLHGAAGGKGYFLVNDQKSYDTQVQKLLNSGIISSEDQLFIQKYANGVPVYLQFFYSPIEHELELLGIDRRYETDIDGIGRIPAKFQTSLSSEPSYTVVGNIPIVVRESLLPEIFSMGERFVDATNRLVPPGMPGPFCIEGIYDVNANFITFEFSARIVAGTNLYVAGSTYSNFLYDIPMSTGRRIAVEIKKALTQSKLDSILT